MNSVMESFLIEPEGLVADQIPRDVRLSIVDLVQVSAFVARSKGWWDPYPGRLTCKLLFQSELSEAFEEFRKGRLETYYSETDHGPKPEGFFVELADLGIRAADTIGRLLATSSAAFAKHGLLAIDYGHELVSPDDDDFGEGEWGVSDAFSDERVGPVDEQDDRLLIAVERLDQLIGEWWPASMTPARSIRGLAAIIDSVFSIGCGYGVDMHKLVIEKSRYNYKRSYRHGNKAC